jgi:hypothetical protein
VDVFESLYGVEALTDLDGDRIDGVTVMWS